MIKLHEKWVKVRMSLQHGLQSVLAAKITNFPVRETNIAKSTKKVIETRCVETNNKHFRLIEENLNKIQSHLVCVRSTKEI